MSNMYPPPDQPPPNDSGYQYGYPPPPPGPGTYSYPHQPVWGATGPTQPPPGPPRRGGMHPGVIVAIIVVVLGAVIGGLALYASKNKDNSTAAVADPMASTPSAQTTTQAPVSTTKDIAETEVGDCLNDKGGEFTADVVVISCTSPHAREVFAAGKLDPGTYNKDYVISRAEKYCKDKFKLYVGISYDDSKLDVKYIYPLASSWNLGDRSVTCLVNDPAHSKTSASAKGSKI
jgi:Septum formation